MIKRFKNRFLAVATAAVAAGFAVHAAAELTVVSFGGSYQEGQSKSMFVPAAKALGIAFKEETYTGIAAVALQDDAVTARTVRKQLPHARNVGLTTVAAH